MLGAFIRRKNFRDSWTKNCYAAPEITRQDINIQTDFGLTLVADVWREVQMQSAFVWCMLKPQKSEILTADMLHRLTDKTGWWNGLENILMSVFWLTGPRWCPCRKKQWCSQLKKPWLPELTTPTWDQRTAGKQRYLSLANVVKPFS